LFQISQSRLMRTRLNPVDGIVGPIGSRQS
jgi:hypothetical protein